MTAEREYSRNEWPLSFLFKADLHDDDNDDDKNKKCLKFVILFQILYKIMNKKTTGPRFGGLIDFHLYSYLMP